MVEEGADGVNSVEFSVEFFDEWAMALHLLCLDSQYPDEPATKAASLAECFVVTTFKRSVKALVSKIGNVAEIFAKNLQESRRLDHSGKTGRTGGAGSMTHSVNYHLPDLVGAKTGAVEVFAAEFGRDLFDGRADLFAALDGCRV